LPPVWVTKAGLARSLGISRETLHDIVGTKRGVTPEMAGRLEAVIGSTAETWLALQSAYDLWHARKTVGVKGLRKLASASG
jgi:addiction module HigA family antidote